jgi:hypothetical protein
MKPLLCLALAIAALAALGQGHDTAVPDALGKAAFLKGVWTGEQKFNTGGDPLVGQVHATFGDAIGGRYIEETLVVTMPGGRVSSTRHFLTYDPTAKTYKAWWFNDSSVGAMELEGTMEGDKLVLMSKPTEATNGPRNTFRATYEKLPSGIGYQLELKTGDTWRLLFRTEYKKA